MVVDSIRIIRLLGHGQRVYLLQHHHLGHSILLDAIDYCHVGRDFFGQAGEKEARFEATANGSIHHQCAEANVVSATEFARFE